MHHYPDEHALPSPNTQRFEPHVLKLQTSCPRDQSVSECLDHLQTLGGFTHAAWQRILWHGGVHVAKQRVFDASSDVRVCKDAPLSVYWFTYEPEPITLTHDDICYDAHGLVAVNKPSWIPAQGTRASIRFSLEHAMRGLVGCDTLQAVHRLDRGTSGLNVFARTSEATARLAKQFAARTAHKEYWAVVSPPPAQPTFAVSGYLVRVAHPRHAFYELRDAPSVHPLEGGRFSHTDFEVVHEHAQYAFVRALPQTGRTHQIRVHLAALGSPIVGDSLYGHSTRDDRLNTDRLLLHAASLTIMHPDPTRTDRITLSAALPEDWGSFQPPPNCRWDKPLAYEAAPDSIFDQSK